MLKFLRKYQLFVLVVGGSLLMVVFLLQPVLTRCAPSRGKQAVATIGPNDTKISALAREQANAEFSAIRTVAPILFAPPSPLAIIDAKEPGDHWLLLAREAEENGLVAEAGDGRDWIPELARFVAETVVMNNIRQQFGDDPRIAQLFLNQPQTQQQIDQLVTTVEPQLYTAIGQAARIAYQFDVEDVEKALAKARGVRRMLILHQRSPRRSTIEAMNAAAAALDGVAADALVLSPDLVVDSIPEPTDEELQAHFETYRDTPIEESDRGISYILPPRIKLQFLTLDAAAIANAVELDRVDVNKRWRQNQATYGADFTLAASRVEQDMRTERARDLMVEADRIIRGALLTATRTVTKGPDGYFMIPDGWAAPTLEDLALQVVADLKTNSGFDFPLPTVTTLATSWLTGTDLAAVPGFGRSAFRIGAQVVPAQALPQIVREIEPFENLRVQVGLPLTETASVDDADNRYYVNVVDARPLSPAESIEEAGRDRVVQDLKQVRSFELFVANAEGYLDVARTSDLDGLAGQFTPAPVPARGAVIRTSADDTERLLDPRVNTDEARASVLDAARERLDPLQGPDDVDPLDAYIAVELPKSRALAVFKLVARRPTTDDLVRQNIDTILTRVTNEEFAADTDFLEKYPFMFESMKRRHNFKLLAAGRRAGEFETDEPADETGDEPGENAETDPTPTPDSDPADEG